MALPGISLAVDDFRKSLGVSHFLLTHMHTDHLRGLRDGWAEGTLYCSPITRTLLLHRFKINPRLVECIELGETRMICMPDHSRKQKIYVDVTAWDANHCPGSAMFMIRGELSPVPIAQKGTLTWQAMLSHRGIDTHYSLSLSLSLSLFLALKLTRLHTVPGLFFSIRNRSPINPIPFLAGTAKGFVSFALQNTFSQKTKHFFSSILASVFKWNNSPTK
jgi:hypothetical protein